MPCAGFVGEGDSSDVSSTVTTWGGRAGLDDSEFMSIMDAAFEAFNQRRRSFFTRLNAVFNWN